MTTRAYDLVVTVERTIAAAPEVVFDAWLDASVPGTVWHCADRHILDAKVDGLFFWLSERTAHYGRFTLLERGKRMEYTWMSPHTLGAESTVRITFKKKGGSTIMTLVHSGLPNTEEGQCHQGGWDHFMNAFQEQVAAVARET